MSARFLLEFEATGDQEVVNAINQVSEAGKQAATDLEGLQNIEDPFTAITEGAQGAVTPLENIGGATEDLSGIFTAAGTQSEEFGGALTSMNDSAMAVEGGLTDANTAVGDFGTAATGAGTSATDAMGGIGQMSGAVVALGGTIGTAVSTIFRMQDAQLSLDKANLKATRSTESARKANVAFDNLLKTAKSNTDGIAQARDKLSEAQDKLNELQKAGVTSGSEYEAAQAAVAEATAKLRSEFAAGGGDVAKFDSALNKVKITGEAQAIATKNLEKATRNFGQTAIDTGFSIAGLVGTGIQAVSSLGKMKEGALTAAAAFKGVGAAIKGIGLGTIGIAFGAAGAAVAVFMGAVIALNKAPYDAIVGQLDKIGKKVGEVFPQAKDMLTSLGDAMGSSLDFLAGYSRGLVKELTGVELQADVTKKSFSELVQIFLKDGTTGYTQINRAIAGYVDAAREQGLTDKEIIDLAKKHNDEKKKSVTATNELTAATVEYGNAADNNLVVTEQIASTIAALPGAIGNTVNDVELFTAAWQKQTGVINNHRNVLATNEGIMIRSGGSYVQLAGNVEDLGTGVSRVNGVLVSNSDILNKSGLSAKRNAESAKTMEAAWQDVTATAEEMETVMLQHSKTQQDTIDKNDEMAHTLLTLLNTEQNQAEALSTVNLAYAQSVDKLADLNTVLGDSEARHQAVQTAVNNTAAALGEEAIKLEAASQSADSLVQQQMRLDNAFKSGVVSIKEWANGLAEAQAEEKGQIAELARMGARWTDIPPFVERTTETLKLFGVAAKEGGEAAKEAANMASEAWRDATSIIGGELGGLAEIFKKGGEDMKESTDEWFAGIEQSIGRNLTGAETAALTGIGHMIESTEQAIADWQLGQIMGESIAQTGTELASAFEGLASTAEGGMKAVFEKAAEIARSGQPDLIAAMNEVMANVGTTAPGALLKELDAILPPGLKASATKAGEGIPGVLDPAAANAGQSAALTLSQEFAAAGVHIASVMAGIEQNMKITPPPIPLDVDITPAGKTLTSLVNTIGSIKQTTPPQIQLDISRAMQQIASLKTQIGGVKAKPIVINVSFKIIGKPPVPKEIKAFISYAYRIVSKIPNPPEIKRFISYAYRITNKIPNPPEIKRWISYRYRVVGSKPNPQNIERTITYRYRTVGSRPAQTGMHETLGEDTMIAAHKGERVDISPNSGGKENVVTGGFGGGGSRIIEIISITQLDGKVLTRNVKRHLMEDVGGVA